MIKELEKIFSNVCFNRQGYQLERTTIYKDGLHETWIKITKDGKDVIKQMYKTVNDEDIQKREALEAEKFLTSLLQHTIDRVKKTEEATEEPKKEEPKQVKGKTFTEHRPSFMDFPCETYHVVSIQDVLELEFVKNFKDEDFFCYAIDKEDGVTHLMAMEKYDEEKNKCTEWWVIGRIEGFTDEELRGFPTFEALS